MDRSGVFTGERAGGGAGIESGRSWLEVQADALIELGSGGLGRWAAGADRHMVHVGTLVTGDGETNPAQILGDDVLAAEAAERIRSTRPPSLMTTTPVGCRCVWAASGGCGACSSLGRSSYETGGLPMAGPAPHVDIHHVDIHHVDIHHVLP